MSGFVSFVGSGPGDPELMTLKAVDRMKQAEVILFDDLSAGPILEFANPSADLIGVGKRAGRASPKQDHVSRLLVDYAQDNARVVRLKSGDSGIFGRLEEEITALKGADIPYEIIPGVTSACAAAAGAGIPLTRRLTARRVQFVTGHDVTGDLPEDMRLQSLAEPDVTTVVYMPKRTFPKFAQDLIAVGLNPDTPAMLVENASHPDQRIVRSTITALAEDLRKDITTAPGLIMYGPLADA